MSMPPRHRSKQLIANAKRPKNEEATIQVGKVTDASVDERQFSARYRRYLRASNFVFIGAVMLKSIAVLTLLLVPGSFVVLGLACLHPGVRAKATRFLGVRFWRGLKTTAYPPQLRDRIVQSHRS
jgi:hypothetical protein